MFGRVGIHREEAKRIIKETLVLYEQRLKYWDDIQTGRHHGWQLTDQTKTLVRHYPAMRAINASRALDGNNAWDALDDFHLSDLLCKCVILADLYKLDVGNLPDLSWAQGGRSPFEILDGELPVAFSSMPPIDQLIYLEEIVNEYENAEMGAKGRKAAELRNLVKDMKLSSLFALKPGFMNRRLRNFLNLNDNGSEDYAWEEITENPDWQEFPSAGAKYHQTTAGDDCVVYKNATGEYITVYTRLNAKFANQKDGREVVFRYKNENAGEQVKEDIDRGTYNYSGRGIIDTGFETVTNGEHQRYDVDPYNKRYLSRAITRENYYLGLLLGNSIYWKWG